MQYNKQLFTQPDFTSRDLPVQHYDFIGSESGNCGILDSSVLKYIFQGSLLPVRRRQPLSKSA
jgi:hypothetical protein